MLLVVVASRFVTIFTLNWVYNVLTLSANEALATSSHKQSKTIPFVELVAFGLGGVVRGCLCWAQVLQINGGEATKVLVQTTLFIVLTTTVICGLLLPVLIPRLTDMIKTSSNLVNNDSMRDGQSMVKKLDRFAVQ